MTPNLKRFEAFSTQIRENIEKQQDKRKEYADQHRKPAPEFNFGDRLLDCAFHQQCDRRPTKTGQNVSSTFSAGSVQRCSRPNQSGAM
ncbi:hypothetical protein CDAR_8951 [Caerostris darwini]|uniref:Uncharacterized protein n=1 Tax=Caerostris darwini TaxID=1538125 RepID=A0AAV4M9Q2_9ARAC|nr:hypothetical protein CDAR_8951 [Caerostris darwini]